MKLEMQKSIVMGLFLVASFAFSGFGKSSSGCLSGFGKIGSHISWESLVRKKKWGITFLGVAGAVGTVVWSRAESFPEQLEDPSMEVILRLKDSIRQVLLRNARFSVQFQNNSDFPQTKQKRVQIYNTYWALLHWLELSIEGVTEKVELQLGYFDRDVVFNGSNIKVIDKKHEGASVEFQFTRARVSQNISRDRFLKVLDKLGMKQRVSSHDFEWKEDLDSVSHLELAQAMWKSLVSHSSVEMDVSLKVFEVNARANQFTYFIERIFLEDKGDLKLRIKPFGSIYFESSEYGKNGYFRVFQKGRNETLWSNLELVLVIGDEENWEHLLISESLKPIRSDEAFKVLEFVLARKVEFEGPQILSIGSEVVELIEMLHNLMSAKGRVRRIPLRVVYSHQRQFFSLSQLTATDASLYLWPGMTEAEILSQIEVY